MNNSFLEINKKNIVTVISVIAIIVIVMPVALTILYSIPASDDFAAALTVSKRNPFSTSVKTANHMYMTWGGIWSFYFLEDLINPLVYFDATGFALGIELLVIFVIFIITIALVIDAIMLLLVGKHNMSINSLILALFLTIFINTEIYTDVYFWFVGNCYMWGLILNNILIVSAIYYLKCDNHSMFRMILLSLFGFFACLDYRGAILSGVVYLFVLFKCSTRVEINIKQILPLVFMVFGGITAVIAPGNFKRQAGMSTGGGLGQAFVDAAWDEMYSLKMAFGKPIIIVAVLGIFAIGLFVKVQSKRLLRDTILTMLTALLVGYLNYFPLALGYGSRALPSRITFGFYYQFFILFSFSLILLGNYISDKFKTIRDRIKILGIVVPIIGLSIILGTGHYRDTVWYSMYNYFPNTKEVSTGWKMIFEEINNSENENVTITIPAYYLGTILMTPQFGDKDNYVNVTAAKYFGKKSLTVNVDWERLFYD